MIFRSLLVDPAAKFEVADAAAAYEATRPGLAAAFLDDFEAIRRKIGQYPESCEAIEPGVRKALFRRFPFGAIYLITPEAVLIIAVFPNRADPAAAVQRADSRRS